VAKLFLGDHLALMMLLLGVIAGGLLFRLRGAAIFERLTGRGKTTADAIYAVGLALVAAPGWWQGAALALALWSGGRAGWWRSLTLGRNPMDGSVLSQWVRHTARGVLWTAPAAVLAWWLGASPVPLLVAGLLCGVAYEAGWRLAGRWGLGGTEWGECFFGAAIGGAVAMTF
jgi:hypothetical protein